MCIDLDLTNKNSVRVCIDIDLTNKNLAQVCIDIDLTKKSKRRVCLNMDLTDKTTTYHKEGLCVIVSSVIPKSLADWYIFPSTSMDTALVHSSSSAY